MSNDVIEQARRMAPAPVKRLAVKVRNHYVGGRARLRMAQQVERLRPQFLIIGAMKAGTTSLFSYLSRHPRVAPPIVKEVRYFDFGWSRPLEWYLAHFPAIDDCRPDAVTGEATPFYLPHPRGPERVAATLPDVKLIVLLRDPVARAISHYYHSVRGGWETRPMDQALWSDQSCHLPSAQMLDDPIGTDAMAGVWRSYVARGLYAEQLENWLRYFDRDRILVLQSEALRRTPKESYARVLDFLSLEAADIGDMPQVYVGKYGRADPEIIRRLREVYVEPNRRLSALLDMEFSWPKT